MAQYIPKSTLVAEIEKRIVEYKDMKIDSSYYEGMVASLEFFRDEFINTLEVKEAAYKPIDKDFERDAVQFCFDNALNTTPRIAKTIAKHFFELGLRSTITEEDCKLIWNIGDEIPNMPEEEFFKELLKRYKAQKGE